MVRLDLNLARLLLQKILMGSKLVFAVLHGVLKLLKYRFALVLKLLGAFIFFSKENNFFGLLSKAMTTPETV